MDEQHFDAAVAAAKEQDPGTGRSYAGTVFD
jgi:hypothetical protein